jgi:hypothetical protein
MSTKGDSRKWQFKLTPVGFVDVSFVACGNLQFPAICLRISQILKSPTTYFIFLSNTWIFRWNV